MGSPAYAELLAQASEVLNLFPRRPPPNGKTDFSIWLMACARINTACISKAQLPANDLSIHRQFTDVLKRFTSRSE